MQALTYTLGDEQNMFNGRITRADGKLMVRSAVMNKEDDDTMRLMASAPDLQEALDICVRFLADLNGCNWIKGDGPGEIDMRQRAKALQEAAFNALTKARG